MEVCQVVQASLRCRRVEERLFRQSHLSIIHHIRILKEVLKIMLKLSIKPTQPITTKRTQPIFKELLSESLFERASSLFLVEHVQFHLIGIDS